MFPDQRSQTPTHFVNLIRETGGYCALPRRRKLLAWIIHEFHKMAIVRAFSASERRLYSVVTGQTSKSG